MLRLDPEALEVLRYLTLDDDPEALARRLYGPRWGEAVRGTDTGWRTSRDPLPLFVADLLEDVLGGAVAHDGRSTRQDRSSGWWARGPYGHWRPVTVGEIAESLHRTVLELVERAVEQHATATARLRALGSQRKPGQRTPETLARDIGSADASARAESLRVAVLSALSHLVASVGRNLETTLTVLRERLKLPDDALASIAERWLDDALLVGDVTPTRTGRVAVADVRAAYDRQGRWADVLPMHALYRSLDALLGGRIRRVEWALPSDPVYRGNDSP